MRCRLRRNSGNDGCRAHRLVATRVGTPSSVVETLYPAPAAYVKSGRLARARHATGIAARSQRP
ncbi:hypothetical protein BVI2075_250027 [Burkholderia vietnamiensis]|nr:hypothetical protein BVI2075_250027 [Burkholderia vietnamiensis]CAG9226004.1 hypothetical protein BVI1335_580020 [Burkholderia vietnamiensis]